MSASNPQEKTITGAPSRRRSALSIALWTVLAIATLLSSWGLSIHMSYRHQMEAIAHVERLGGSVGAGYEGPEWIQRLRPGRLLFGPEPLGPDWLRDRLPAEAVGNHFLVVECVALDNAGGLHLESDYSGEYRFTRPIIVSDNDLRMIVRFQKLQNLNLAETPIGDSGLDHLRKLTEIRQLNLNFTQISDTSMDVIAGFEKLEVLRLVGTQVTDAGLAKLTGLKNLQELDVSETRVTQAGLSPFRGRPGLDLIFDDADDSHPFMIR